MAPHKLTGKDVMRYRKTSLADRIVLWASTMTALFFIFVSLFN